MNDINIKSLPQVRAFLDGTRAVGFSLHTQSERYDFVRPSLIRFAYHTLTKPDKGVVLSFLVHVSAPGSYLISLPISDWPVSRYRIGTT